ncbi:MAG: N-acetylmuramoyl-L-alanine amidase [Gillisia sp.]
MKWKKIIRSFGAMLIFLSNLLLSAQVGGGSKVIIIDPGHGGRDPGAIGINEMKEKDIVLNLAKEILKLNKEKFNYDIYLTRYTDTLVSLKNRTNLAKSLSADLFLSLHCNHSANPFARGNEIYVANTILSHNLETSILIANRLSLNFTKRLGIIQRGVKFSNFQVLRNTINNFPSLLIELCFLSNKEEAAFLSKKGIIQAMALLILESL